MVMFSKSAGFAALLGVILLVAGCPSGGGDGNQNGNDNTNTNTNTNTNNNTNTNGNGNDNTDEFEPGVDTLIPNEGAAHVPVNEQVDYDANPPASGPHWSAGGIAPVAAGVYEEALEEEQWIHNLEHGYVVILFDCRGPCQPTFIEQLDELFEAAPPSEMFGNTKLVISPYDGLPFAIAAVAWDHQLHLESFDQETLLEFYGTYVDQGPEDVP